MWPARCGHRHCRGLSRWPDLPRWLYRCRHVFRHLGLSDHLAGHPRAGRRIVSFQHLLDAPRAPPVSGPGGGYRGCLRAGWSFPVAPGSGRHGTCLSLHAIMSANWYFYTTSGYFQPRDPSCTDLSGPPVVGATTQPAHSRPRFVHPDHPVGPIRFAGHLLPVAHPHLGTAAGRRHCQAAHGNPRALAPAGFLDRIAGHSGRLASLSRRQAHRADDHRPPQYGHARRWLAVQRVAAPSGTGP